MLILTRRVQEALMIGDNVVVTVLSVKGNQVRLGIDAPKDVEVHREEIYHRVKSGIPQGEPKSAKPEAAEMPEMPEKPAEDDDRGNR